VALALVDVVLGKFARRISGRIRAIGNLLAEPNAAWFQRREQQTGRHP
jgi:hypothetical protein